MSARDGGVPSCAGPCPDCGKLRWTSRAHAKHAARQMKGRDGSVRPYRCGDYWHLGHPPTALLRGVISRDQIPPALPREPYRPEREWRNRQ